MNRVHIAPESRVTVSANQVASEVADEVIILSLENGEYFGLNPVAARVWSLVQEPCTVAELCTTLLAEFTGVTPEACRDQVIALLEEMAALALVEVT